MPLRDHFHPPVSRKMPWEAIHGGWPMVIVQQLNKKLPPGYVSMPKVHVGRSFEVDIGAREDHSYAGSFNDSDSGGGTATATWTETKPTLKANVEIPDETEYEVKIFDVERDMTLVAAIELVSPSNEDRDSSRTAFVNKCEALLRKGVAVSIVDVVTERSSNLYMELLDSLGQKDPAMAAEPSIYAASCRWYRDGHRGRFEAWSHTLEIGKVLPRLPLWLAEDLVVPLDLEESYVKVCEDLNLR
jgi:hypothetical protein